MKRFFFFIPAVVGSLLIAAVLAQGTPTELTATVTSSTGEELGTVAFSELTAEEAAEMGIPAETGDGAVLIRVQVRGLTPGFHGFHIHAVGVCDPAGERPFTSAGGHMHQFGEVHGQHTGDLPSLLASADGLALLTTVTDRFTLEDLIDTDGSAVIIHAAADNFANIPADRYRPDADETTLNTGDAGGRVLCGVITAK